MSVVYDAGALIAADRNDRQFWAEHLRRLARGRRPTTTSTVVAQVSRDTRQTHLHRLLESCEIEPFAVDEAHEVGRLLAAARTSDVVDAHLVQVAGRRRARIITADPDDMRHLSDHSNQPVPIRSL